MYKTIFFVFAIIFQNFPQGKSLICYSCSTTVGHSGACENITDHFSDISHQECFYHNAVCAVYKIQYGGDVMIYRSCKEGEICTALTKKFNVQYNRVLDCNTCNKDLCNYGEKLYVPYGIIIVLGIFNYYI